MEINSTVKPNTKIQTSNQEIINTKSKNTNKEIFKSKIFWLISIATGIIVICFILFFGYFGLNIYKNYSYPTEQSPTPTLSNTSKDIVDQILNWQFYENKNLGLSLKYPSKYKLKEFNKKSETLGGITSKYGISIIGEDYFISISTADNPNNLTTKEVINNIITEFTKKRIAYNKVSTGNEPYDYYGSIIQGIQLTSRNYKLGDINGTLFDYGGMDHSQQYIYVTVNNKIYEIVFSDLDGQIVTEVARKDIDQILSTIKFADSINISNWKTYTNTDIGYSIKYPDNIDKTYYRSSVGSFIQFNLPDLKTKDESEKYFRISDSEFPYNSLEEARGINAGQSNYIWKTTSRTPYNISGIEGEIITELIPANQYDPIDLEKKSFLIKKGKMLLALEVRYRPIDKEKTIMYFDKMLSTFKFD